MNVYKNIVNIDEKYERDPEVDPRGTPALMGFQVDAAPDRTTLCLRSAK